MVQFEHFEMTHRFWISVDGVGSGAAIAGRARAMSAIAAVCCMEKRMFRLWRYILRVEDIGQGLK